ncbi:MAG: ribonuclease HI [Candidatus Gastranaerophilales bacterium]|nr:ribonuclease HI [Candidatus Gastranaerophilales bacterium]
MSKNNLPKVIIYTDGACAKNPGAGGYGAILMFKKQNGEVVEKRLSRGFSMTTNNRMELLAVIEALNSLKKPCEVQLYSDSKYVTEAINQKWLEGWINKNWKLNSKNPVKNIDLWKKYIEASKIHTIEFIWVKGHNSNKYNELCDKLAVEARSCANLETDTGFK